MLPVNGFVHFSFVLILTFEVIVVDADVVSINEDAEEFVALEVGGSVARAMGSAVGVVDVDVDAIVTATVAWPRAVGGVAVAVVSVPSHVSIIILLSLPFSPAGMPPTTLPSLILLILLLLRLCTLDVPVAEDPLVIPPVPTLPL